MGHLLRSLLKHSKPNSELSFYATLLSTNVELVILVPVAKALSILKRRSALGAAAEGRSDDLYRKVKMTYADVIDACKKIFGKIVASDEAGYENLGGAHLKHRVRDYILKIQTNTTILECNGLTFLEVVLREAALIKTELQKHSTSEPKNEDDEKDETTEEVTLNKLTSNPSPQKASNSRDQVLQHSSAKKHASASKGHQPLYGFADVMGEEMPKIGQEEIRKIKKMQQDDNIMFGSPSKGTGGDKQNRTAKAADDASFQAQGETFDDLYTRNITDKQEDRMCMAVIKDCQLLEQKIKQLKDEMAAFPDIKEKVNIHKVKIAHTIHDRKAKTQFMQTTMNKMKAKGPEIDEEEQETLEDIEELSRFYTVFCRDIDRLLDMQAIVERHSLSEYMQTGVKPESANDLVIGSRKNSRNESARKDSLVVPEEKPKEIVFADISSVNPVEQSPFFREPAEKMTTPQKKFGDFTTGSPISKLLLVPKAAHEREGTDVSKYMIRLAESAQKRSYDSQQEFEDHERAVKLMMEEDLVQPDEANDNKPRHVKRESQFSNRKIKKIDEDSSTVQKSQKSKIKIKDASSRNQSKSPIQSSDRTSTKLQIISPSKEAPVVQNRRDEVALPPLLANVDSSKYENMIYGGKKKKMYIVNKECRVSNKNYISLRQGDIVCSVKEVEEWSFVYFEENPKKFGFYPTAFLAFIS